MESSRLGKCCAALWAAEDEHVGRGESAVHQRPQHRPRSATSIADYKNIGDFNGHEIVQGVSVLVGNSGARQAQQDLPFSRRGGKRPGAGRPALGPRSSERHQTRPRVRASHPVHVTIRTNTAVGSLRRLDRYAALRRALITTFTRDGFRIVHLSIQRTHVHLLVEADDRMKLARGMQSFQISAARHLNRLAQRRGTVFADRYHADLITSPRRARHALAYVLNNWRRHGERGDRIDPYSSASSFDGWAAPVPAAVDPLPVWRPKSWLLTVGWRRHGRIDPEHIPGPRPR